MFYRQNNSINSIKIRIYKTDTQIYDSKAIPFLAYEIKILKS